MVMVSDLRWKATLGYYWYQRAASPFPRLPKADIGICVVPISRSVRRTCKCPPSWSIETGAGPAGRHHLRRGSSMSFITTKDGTDSFIRIGAPETHNRLSSITAGP